MQDTYPQKPQVAVGAVVQHRKRILLVLRDNPPAAGEWAIPGGRVHLGETCQAAAEREVLEETGILIRAVKPILVFDSIERDDMGSIRFHYVIVDYAAEYIGGQLRAGDDARDARWFTWGEMGMLKLNAKTRQLLTSLTPAFTIDQP
jgi:ADP-ribose pyrophosphatase